MTGFEPATSRLTTGRSAKLSYTTAISIDFPLQVPADSINGVGYQKCDGRESNPRRSVLQTDALPLSYRHEVGDFARQAPPASPQYGSGQPRLELTASRL